MKNIKAFDSKMILSGPAGTVFHTEQKFRASLEVNGCTVDVYSVPHKDIMCDFIVGRSLFQTSTEVKISPVIVEINKISSDIQQIMAIEIEGNELDIGCRKHTSTISNLVYSYKPGATEIIPMKTKILLIEEPIYQRPRRLSPKEKEFVEK